MRVGSGAATPGATAFELPFGTPRGGATITVRPGEIVAVCGENGAGLEELLDTLKGRLVDGAVAGDFLAGGPAPRRHAPSGDGRARPAVLVGSRSGLSPALDVTENLFLNRLFRQKLGPFVIGLDWKRMRAEALEHLRSVGCHVPVTAIARDIGETDRIRVELARALARDAALLLIDEPTAHLGDDLAGRTEGDQLLELLVAFRDRGIAVVVVTQKPAQALRYADAVIVARDGAVVAGHHRAECEADGAEAVRQRILTEMVTRESAPAATLPHPAETADPEPAELLRIVDWSVRSPLLPNELVVSDVSLTVRAGEIVGIAGLRRSGADTLLLSVYGRSDGVEAQGEVRMRGQVADTSTVAKAIEAGMFLAATGGPRYSMRFAGGIAIPVSASRLRGFAGAGMIESSSPSDGLGGRLLDAVRSTGREGDTVSRIRGLVREFAISERSVLMLSDPTRGAGPDQRAEILDGLRDAADAGKGVLLVSDDLELLLGTADRVIAMAEGRIRGEVPGGSPATAIAGLIAPG